MKIPFTSDIHIIDSKTIKRQNISSEELMERAGLCLTKSIIHDYPASEYNKKTTTFTIFAGPGNNGGDGLVIGRLLVKKEYKVKVFLLSSGRLSRDCDLNRKKLLEINKNILTEININECKESDINKIINIKENDIIIDAIFGSGLNKPLEGFYATIVDYINNSNATIISIDIPSGLDGDGALYNNDNNAKEVKSIINADITLTIQFPKLSFLFPENEKIIGNVKIIDISLDNSAIKECTSPFSLTKLSDIKHILPKRSKFSHKGIYGHALLIAGSYGMAGASILSAKACLRTGVGLISIHAPKNNNEILQISVPEAIVENDDNNNIFTSNINLKYDAVGIGPGIGTSDNTIIAFKNLLDAIINIKCQTQTIIPLIIDADAINIIGIQPELLSKIPKETILTPHLKEFERLLSADGCTKQEIENCRNSTFTRLKYARNFAKKYHCNVIIKGAYSAVITSEGLCRFNPTGNPGMATAGSGDILTGIILALLAQRITPANAALYGAYIHGLAGDIAANNVGKTSLIASDIIQYLPQTLLTINQ